ncbi:MAG: cyclase family protein [Anaerolineae bacterium]|nr:MAG: cyclase family protein [Anaerolineae bacterium]
MDLRYKEPQSYITVADLQAFGDRIQPGCRLIFWTDWDKQFPQPHYFGDQPRLHVETCEWMVQQGYAALPWTCPRPTLRSTRPRIMRFSMLKPRC